MIGIFWRHCAITKLPFDMGARTCEFLFLVSGFLVAYNYVGRDVPATWSKSASYATSKVIKMWPPHFIAFLIVFIFATQTPFTKTNLLKAALNLSLLQSWSPTMEVFFSFNGASWFLSSLIFCYFMAPMLLRFVKDVPRSAFYFVIITIIRFMIEAVPIFSDVRFWQMNLHVHPIVRCLEFFMGMLTVPLFSKFVFQLTKYYLKAKPMILCIRLFSAFWKLWLRSPRYT